MIDFHCHLDLYENPHEIVRECVSRGVDVLSVTTTPSAWDGTFALSAKAEGIRTALGLHPQLAKERKGELGLFDELLETTQFVGEVGLDGGPEFRNSWSDQIMVFDHILSSCQSAGGKILSVHSRHAAPEVLQRIESYDGCKYILHWFSGKRSELQQAVELGCWFSVGPSMISGKKGRELISEMPYDRILTETDGPFTSIAGRKLLPWDSSIVVDKLAEVWKLTIDEANAQIEQNLRILLS